MATGWIRREHVADFHAQDFQHAIRRRGDFHFAELRVQFGELRADLGDSFGPRAGQQQVVAALGGSDRFFQTLCAGEHPVALGFGDDFFGEEIVGALPIGARQFQLRGLRLPFGFGGGDFLLARAGFGFGQLRGEQIMARPQFSRVQFDNDLSVGERLAFLRKIFSTRPP